MVANVQDCDIQVNDFEPHSIYYVHFRINNLGKDINTFYPHSSYVLNSITAAFLQGRLWHLITYEG